MPTKKEKDYRAFLKTELAQRTKRNPLYSMRSFARDLGMSPPRLSCILSGKFPLSLKAANQVSTLLHLSQESQKEFLKSVMKEKIARKLNRSRPKDAPHYDELSKENFLLVSEWYHFAILELTYLRDFVGDAKWIAQRLGITTEESAAAIERLQNLKLLKILRSGKYKTTSDWTLGPSEFSSDAIKRAHAQTLKKAIDAVYRQDLESRHYKLALMAVNTSDLPEAKREIDKFIDHFLVKFGKGKTKDAVYAVSTQFFRIDESPASAERGYCLSTP